MFESSVPRLRGRAASCEQIADQLANMPKDGRVRMVGGEFNFGGIGLELELQRIAEGFALVSRAEVLHVEEWLPGLSVLVARLAR